MIGTDDVQAYRCLCLCVCESLGSDSLGRTCQTNNPNCNGVLSVKPVASSQAIAWWAHPVNTPVAEKSWYHFRSLPI